MELPILSISDDVYVVVVDKLSDDSAIEVINLNEHSTKATSFIAATLKKLVSEKVEIPTDAEHSGVDKDAIPNKMKMESFEISQNGEKEQESYELDVIKNSKIELADYSARLKNYSIEDKVSIENFITTMNQCAKVGLPRIPDHVYEFSGNEYICLICEQSTKREHGAIKHYRYVHGPDHHKCLACCRSYKRFTSLRNHEEICKGEKATLLRVARKIYNEIKPNRDTYRKIRVPCRICKKLISRKSMKEHLAVHANRKSEKKFKCKMCPAEFCTLRSKIAHVNAHTGHRPYKCDQCTRAYTSDTALRAHKYDHCGRTFVCEICSSAFKRKDSLTSHLNIHKEAGTYLCPDCGKVLNTEKSFERHMSMHAGNLRRYSCVDCNKSYGTMYSLNFHMRRKHGKQLVTRKMFFDTLPKIADVSSLLNLQKYEYEDNEDSIE